MRCPGELSKGETKRFWKHLRAMETMRKAAEPHVVDPDTCQLMFLCLSPQAAFKGNRSGTITDLCDISRSNAHFNIPSLFSCLLVNKDEIRTSVSYMRIVSNLHWTQRGEAMARGGLQMRIIEP